MPEADLVIVGCGPVGAMAALRARQHGLSVIALDRESEVYPWLRAVGMDDEIQRLFALQAFSMDCDPAVRLVVRVSRPSRPPRLVSNFLSASLDRMAIPRSSRSISPPWNECCVKLPSVRGPICASGLTLPLDGSKLTLSDGATITGRWVLGSDGARSTVRRQLGIELENRATWTG